ncbi:MAG: hypothetical protein V3T64_10850, partial [Myxococcota bacterium]
RSAFRTARVVLADLRRLRTGSVRRGAALDEIRVGGIALSIMESNTRPAMRAFSEEMSPIPWSSCQRRT